MAKKKIYAVKNGHRTGIFYTWEECKKAVDGYSGAEYKGFMDKKSAMEYLGISAANRSSAANNDAISAREQKKSGTEAPHIHVPADSIIAYVDGSFDKKIKRYSFGCVLLTPDGDVIRKSGNGNQPDSLAIRNVAGEMLGAMYAVRWSIKNGYHFIEIRYDYEGIEKWVTGAWRAKTDLTQKYAGYMRRCGEKIKISFLKVAAHTGDYYNEEADQLAKKALTEGEGIPEV